MWKKSLIAMSSTGPHWGGMSSPTGTFSDTSSPSAAPLEGDDLGLGFTSGGEDTDKDGDGIWSQDIEQAFIEAMAVYPPCGRRKIILSEEGKMYGRNELIARYIRLRTGKHRSRKQVSSHIQVLGRRQSKHIAANFKAAREQALYNLSVMSTPTKNGLSGFASPLFSPTREGLFFQPLVSPTPYKEGYQSHPSTPHSDCVRSDLASPLQSGMKRGFLDDPDASPMIHHKPSSHRSLIPSFNLPSPHPDHHPTLLQSPSIHPIDYSLAQQNSPSWMMTDINRNVQNFAHPALATERHPLGRNPRLEVNDLVQPPGPCLAQPPGPCLAQPPGPWQDCRIISGSKLQLLTLSAAVEQQRPDCIYTHQFVNVEGSANSDQQLETISISQIQDKFPSGLRELYERSSQSAFYLIKFWADMNVKLEDNLESFYFTTSVFESSASLKIQCSTKVCSFGQKVVEKLEKEPARVIDGRYFYRFHRSTMCDYLVNFIVKLRQLPETYMMNSVLENFTVLQVVSDLDTNETLLCVGYVFEVSDGDSGPQHHIYRLTQ